MQTISIEMRFFSLMLKGEHISLEKNKEYEVQANLY